MKLSISITDYSWPSDLPVRLAETAMAAEDAGLDTVWVPDHLLQADPNSTPDSAMLEAYTTLGYLAGRTSTVGLGAMVSAATFRPPALLIKAVTTLDAISGGRARFGIGTGHHEGEARDLGLPFPPLAERYTRMEETVQLARKMWEGDESPFQGKHYQLERPVCSPRPQRPPRLLIGGHGEQKTLRMVARYADACNIFDMPDGGRTVQHKLAVLDRHCEEVGRPSGDIERTISTRLSPGESADSFARRCNDFAEWGIDHAVMLTAGPWTTESIDTLRRVRELLG